MFPHIENQNVQATIYFKKKDIKKETQKKLGPALSCLIIGVGNSTSVYNSSNDKLLPWLKYSHILQ